MVHATWGDWFVQDEIEGSDPDGVSVWYLGCNAFVLRSPSTTVYIDPYFGEGDPPFVVRMIPVPIDPSAATACDVVFITHEHLDHMHPPSFTPLLELGADVYGTKVSLTDPDYDGALPAESKRSALEEGDEVTVGDFTVHVRGANDPDANGAVSYVFEHEAGTFFHPGDSRPAEAFQAIGNEFDIDLGTLALGTRGNIFYTDEGKVSPTVWYMNGDQVIEAANALQLDRLLPSHYDMWKGVGADPKGVHDHAASFDYPKVVEVAKIGDRLDLGTPGIQRLQSLR